MDNTYIQKLVQDAKSPDKKVYEPAITILLAQYNSMIYSICYQFKRTNLEDLYQAGVSGFLESLNSFNGASNFITWSYIQIRRRIQEEFSKDTLVNISRYYRKKGKISISIPISNCIETSYEDEPSKNLQNMEDIALVMAKLRKINHKLSKRDSGIFVEFYYLNNSLRQLDAKYGCCSRNVIKRIVKMLK
jgi:RNA polymerase sigma factor (sigma-70 family)